METGEANHASESPGAEASDASDVLSETEAGDDANRHLPLWMNIPSFNSSDRTIRIPKVLGSLRSIESNYMCFDPMVLSLGPYHMGTPQVLGLNLYKLLAAKRFTRSDQQMTDMFNQMFETILETKECYETELPDPLFAMVMFIDTCFVLDFMEEVVVGRNGNDMSMRLSSHERTLVARDMMLLENQLPLPLLAEFMSFRNRAERPIGHLRRRIRHRRRRRLQESVETQPPLDIIIYINEFIDKLIGTHNYSTMQPLDPGGNPQEDQGTDEDEDEPIHLLDCLRRKILGKGSKLRPPSNWNGWYSFRSITELKEAGIKVQRRGTHHLKDVGFRSYLFCRELLLPSIVVDNTTKYMLLNMIAYELGPDGPPTSWITSYACFIDSLIHSKEDVKELRSKGILLNALGSDEEVADLFNALTTGIVPDSDAYAHVKAFIESNCKNRWCFSLTKLYYTHFSSPWTTVAFFAAVFLLFLIVVQTYFMVFPR